MLILLNKQVNSFENYNSHGETKTGFSTGVDVLEKLAPNFKLLKIFRISMYNKLVTTYVMVFNQVSDENHFIHQYINKH